MTTAPFVWQVPTRISAGQDSLAGIGPESAALGSCAVVIVDARAARNPVVGAALASLGDHGVSTPAVCRSAGTPTLARVREVVAEAAAHRANLVVGIGGGSVMDLAKVTALGATNPDLLQDDTWSGAGVLDRYQDGSLQPGLPSLLVPTTAATGSEVNVVAALEHQGQRRLLVCGGLAPATALLDARVLHTLSDRALLDGVLETFARLLGPYLTDARDEVDTTDRVTEALCHQTLTLGDQLATGGRTPGSDADLLWLTTVTGTHLATVGRPSWGHTLWYLQDTVGAVTGLPKGPATAAVLPAYLESIASARGLGAHLGSADRLRSLITAVEPLLGSTEDRPGQAARVLLQRWGMPTSLRDLDLTPGNGGIVRLGLLAHERWSTTGLLRGATADDFTTFFTSAAEVQRPARGALPPVTTVTGPPLSTRKEVNV